MKLSVGPLRSHLTAPCVSADLEPAPSKQCSLLLLSWDGHMVLSVHTRQRVCR